MLLKNKAHTKRPAQQQMSAIVDICLIHRMVMARFLLESRQSIPPLYGYNKQVLWNAAFMATIA
jgi:hypothetical protein